MKIDDIIKNLFFALMLGVWLIIILFIVNTLCGKCIHKDLDKILNIQGYAYDVKYNTIEPYTRTELCDSCEKPKFAKQRFTKNSTTGFMTFMPPEEGSTCRSCN